MVVIQTLFTNLTPPGHICWMVCSLTVTYDWFPIICCKSWRVTHVGQEMPNLSGTPDLIPFGEFMISPIHYILLNLSVLGLFLRINDSGLFAWISLTALSRTYFIIFSYSALDCTYMCPCKVRLTITDWGVFYKQLCEILFMLLNMKCI